MSGMAWVAVVGVLGALGYAGLLKFQNFIIYPSHFPEDSRTKVELPSQFKMQYEDVTIKTSDGESLKGYRMDRQPIARQTIVMFGPNAGNIGHSLPYAKLFYEELKCNVLTVSYRGYGLSTGRPSERGLKLDADAILEYIKQDLVLSSTSVVFYGRSLGGAVVIYAASTKLGRELVAGIILENTFLSIPKLVDSVMPLAKPFKALMTENWLSEQTILELQPELQCLFLGSDRDELVPPSHFQGLYELCPCTNKQFVHLPNGTHSDAPHQPNYWRSINQFLHGI